MKDSKQKYKFAFKYGDEKGFNLVLNGYDKYRKIMYWVLFGAFLFMFGRGKWMEAAILFFIWHLNTLLNQIWYKILNIENWIKENDKTNESRRGECD